MAKMSRQHVPYAGILATLVCMSSAYSSTIWCRRAYLRLVELRVAGNHRLMGVYHRVPERLRKAIKEGKAADVSFKLPARPSLPG